MTRRETGIVAFAIATLVLAVVIVVGHVSFRLTPDRQLPALNGPPPAATPGGPTGPLVSPSPAGSAPPLPATANVAMSHLEPGEDEAEDEPASAERASSRSTGSSSASASRSGGQGLIPGAPLKLPGGTPPLPELCCPPPGLLALAHR